MFPGTCSARLAKWLRRYVEVILNLVVEQSSWVRIPHLAKNINSGFWEIQFPKSEDVRVVKETVSRSVGASRKGSNPFPRIQASLCLLQIRPPQFLGFCAPKKKNSIAIAQW
jgi:hypothetical protein